MTTWVGALHFSQSARGWFGAFALQPDGRALLRHELTFVHKVPEDVADDIKAKTKAWDIGAWAYIVAQPDIFPKPKEVGETVSETFRKAGVYLRAGSDDRIARWARLRSWLQPRQERSVSAALSDRPVPALTIHADCKHFLRTLPTLVADETKPDDVASTPDEYPALAASYFVMSRPMPRVDVPVQAPPGYLTLGWFKAQEGPRKRGLLA